jgi:hypothetical protein
MGFYYEKLGSPISYNDPVLASFTRMSQEIVL